jgi:hypothetical protein
MPTWTPPVTLTANTNENVNDLNAIITSLQAVINGLDDANISATAGIQASKLASGATGLAQGTFSAFRNAAVSLATAGIIVFDTEEFDVSGWFDTTTGAFTPQVPGYYQFSWVVTPQPNLSVADTFWRADLYKNATRVKNGQVGFQRGTAVAINSIGTAIAQANGTTDAFTVGIAHNVGSAMAIRTGADGTLFQGSLIGRS